MKAKALLAVVALLGMPLLAAAQDDHHDDSGPVILNPKLGTLIPTIYGPGGLIVDSLAVLPDGSTHAAHFNSAFQQEFTQFNVALATQLLTVPFPSPASGYTYTYDESLGVFTRSTQSFGPILTERAETIGRGKFTFGFAYQRFQFDSIEGVPLSSVPAVFTHDDFQLGGGRADVVNTTNNIQADFSRFIAFVTFGLTDHLDVSAAIPLVDASLRATSQTQIVRVGTASNPAIHFFDDGQGGFGDRREFTASGSASGLGDVLLRLKATAPQSGPTRLAFLADVRFPTGDEEDLLGSGSWGVKPLVVVSWALGKVSPHVNLGYQWNGESILGGDISTGQRADMPDQFLYAGGADIGVHKNLTLAVDVIGQKVVDAPRLVERTFTAADGSTFDQVGFERGSYYVNDLSLGFKVRAGGSLLLDLNFLIKLDNAGLRADVAPLVGFEYSF
jgi:hypothetical protein